MTHDQNTFISSGKWSPRFLIIKRSRLWDGHCPRHLSTTQPDHWTAPGREARQPENEPCWSSLDLRLLMADSGSQGYQFAFIFTETCLCLNSRLSCWMSCVLSQQSTGLLYSVYKNLCLVLKHSQSIWTEFLSCQTFNERIRSSV